jgi:hypothetical protein
MKSRSICFSDEEVNAVLDGRMTMFARPIKDQPEIKYGALYWTSSKYNNGMGVNYFHTKSVVGIMYAWKKACPFGVVGDQLWIKEVWGIVSEKRKEFEALPLFEYACPDCDSKNEWDQLKAMEVAK